MVDRPPPAPRIRPFRTFTMRFGNPLTRRIAGRLPWFCIISYVGRTSGRRYRTPMNVFRDGEDYIFALTYGGDVQWVKNVLAAGEADIETMGRTVALRDPRPFVDPGRRLMPLPVRFFLGLIRVSEFLRMSPAQPG